MKKKLIRSVLLAVIITGIVVVGVGCAVTLPAFDPSKLETSNHVTVIYDKSNDEKTAIKLNADEGEPVDYKNLPIYMKEAIISIEDRRFYDHNGVDFTSIGRAIYRDILSGSRAEGGSTITQQLAINTFLSRDKSFSLKIKQIALSAQIERSYTKDEILEMYMNKVNFHPSVLGLESASQIYFGKSATKVNLGEAAFLAGLPQAPSYYYPGTEEGKKASIERRNLVLQAMLRDHYITQEQYDTALKQKFDVSKMQQKSNVGLKYPHYVEYVLQEASSKYNIPAEQILRGGLKIHTNLDPEAQQIAEKEFSNPANFPPNAQDGVKVEGGMVITDPKKGAVLAVVGNRDPNSFLNWNYAISSGRSPGSVIKPVMVYGPAIETGNYGPNSMLNDKPGTTFPGGYAPSDWDFHKQIPRGDQVTMSEALRESWNVPAVSLLNEIGVDTGKQFATKAGIPFDKDDQYLALALGAFKKGVSPLQMADAYGAFVNNGNRMPAYAISKIETTEGSVIAQANVTPVRVMKEQTAQTMTSMLQGVVNEGLGKLAQISGRQIAGKTGTTEFGKTGDQDAWFVGYSPQLVTSVWMGFANTDQNHYLKDGSYPVKMYSKVMSQVLRNYPAASFSTPPVAEKPKEEKMTAITDLSAVWSKDGKSVELKWTPLEGGNLNYVVFRADNVNGTAGESGMIGFANDAAFKDADVQPSSGYFYAVTVQDMKTGKQMQSNIVSLAPFDGKTQPPKDPSKKPDDKPKDPKSPGTDTITPGTGNTGGEGGTGSTGSQGGTGAGGIIPGGTTPPPPNSGGTPGTPIPNP